MKIPIPADLPADPREAYRRGWRDGVHASHARAGAKGGRAKSEAKAAAARANAKLPRKRKPQE